MAKKIMYRFKIRGKLKEMKKEKKEMQGTRGKLAKGDNLIKFILYDTKALIAICCISLLYFFYKLYSISLVGSDDLLFDYLYTVGQIVALVLLLLGRIMTSRQKYYRFKLTV